MFRVPTGEEPWPAKGSSEPQHDGHGQHPAPGQGRGLWQTLLNTVGRAREGRVEELRPLCLALRVCVAGEEQGPALGQRWQGRALAGGPGAGQLWP